jgi:Domain of unknown function (DUF4160)
MPAIAIFYGIVIQMFFDDHNPPHFHARYGRSRAMIRISDGKILIWRATPYRGAARSGVGLARRRELEENWRRGLTHEAMERIAGPDGNG